MQLIKRLSLLMLVLLVAANLNAQKIEWGVKNKAKSKWYNPYILTEDKESVYTTYFDDENVVIEKHNLKGAVVYSNELKLDKINGEKPVVEKISFLKDRFVLFVSCFDNKNDKAILYALSYSGKTGKKIGKDEKLLDVPVEKKKRKGSFYIFISKDESKFLVNHYAFYKNEGKMRDRYKLFDNEMNLLMEKNEVINKSEIDYSTNNYVIDIDGSVYFIKKMEEGDAYIVSYDATKDFEKWEEKVDVSKLDKNQSVGFLKFGFDNNNDLVITGICSQKEKDSKGLFKVEKVNPVGVMIMKLDKKSKEVKVMKIHKMEIKSSLKKGEYFFTDQTLHFTAKNDVVFISQIFKEQASKSALFMYDGELIVAKFDESGELKWNGFIPKMQVSVVTASPLAIAPSLVNTLYFTYVSGVNADKLFIIYNDTPKNINIQDPSKVKAVTKVSKTVPLICTFDLATGKKEAKQFFDPKVAKNYLRTKISYQRDYKSDLLTLAQDKGIYQLVRINLNSK